MSITLEQAKNHVKEYYDQGLISEMDLQEELNRLDKLIVQERKKK
jgi:hypothetical protein